MFTLADTSKIFLRSWLTESNDVLLILHGLGAHSGWFIDMGNELAARGLNVYTMDHRGFGRSEGLAGHIDSYHLFVEDTAAIINELHKRHPLGRIYLLGHSMGGIFTAHIAAKHADLLAGALFLNPWIEDLLAFARYDHIKNSIWWYAQIPSCLAGGGWTRGNDHQSGSNPDVTGRYLLAANADFLVPRADSSRCVWQS